MKCSLYMEEGRWETDMLMLKDIVIGLNGSITKNQ